ncbi:MAG TPA: tetratricopeptide repeat protein [Bryobacteraceae bacterium]|nr:tetratricopeptide repeat protein [Bryobacteraceae bacterium]
MIDASEVNAALGRILATPAFVRSPRLAEFLRYVVGQRVAGRTDAPKESEIGSQVFGRPLDYDSRIDPVVRVQARLLRFKLHEYYETVGNNDAVRIDLPKGSYLPAFSTEPSASQTPAAPPPSRRSVNLGWVVAAVLIVGAFITVAISWNAWREAIGKVWAKTLPVRPKAAQSPAADLYLKGRYYWNKRTPDDLQKAVDYFTQSIVADSGYARAYVGLADCYGLLREFAAMPDSEAWPRALAAARKAVELDDSLAEAHSSLGFDLFYGALDLKNGERELKRAVELNPNYAEGHHWYATALMSVGRLPEAADEMERARELDPASRSILADQGLVLFYQGKREQAIEQLRQIEAAEPGFRSAHLYLSYIYFASKDDRDYLAESRIAAQSSHDSTELAVVSEAEKGFRAGGSQGMLEGLLRIQKKLNVEGRYPAYMVAETYAMLGRRRDALDYLDASYKNRELYMTTLPINAAFDRLHADPEYRSLLTQLGMDVRN